jgi:pyruvate formate lyase activating enzyme
MNDKEGLIFHIIHGSFVDGHGIRTTVFLKGCPLRCIWCCNPEGQVPTSELKFTESLCNGCGKCVEVCPVDAINISQTEDDRILIDEKACTNCGKCIDACFTGALDRFGKYYTVDELFDIVNKDVSFYKSSGGGVTIGGGEPTFQTEFTAAFLKKCRENYIHTAIDTCGYTVNDEGLRILENADLLLFDLKGIDADDHKRNTGVSNEKILANLKHLDAMGKSIIIRVPLVPGCTDSDVNVQDMADFLSNLKSVERVDLMGYHEFGTVKYLQLGREYKLNANALSDERLNDIKTIFEQHGLDVQIGG